MFSIPRIPLTVFCEHGLKTFLTHWSVRKRHDGVYASASVFIVRACLGLHPIVEHARRLIGRDSHTVTSIAYVPETIVHDATCPRGCALIVVHAHAGVDVLREDRRAKVQHALLLTCLFHERL